MFGVVRNSPIKLIVISKEIGLAKYVGNGNLRFQSFSIGRRLWPYNIQSNERIKGKDLHNFGKDLHFIQ